MRNEFTSIWLFEKQKTDILAFKDGMAKIKNFRAVRGDNYSEFNPTTAKKIIKFWSKEGDTILDPFAGRTRAEIASTMGRNYIGFEISKKAYTCINESLNKPRLEDSKAECKIFNTDCLNISEHLKKDVDLIFTCPPYFNIEKYESCKGQLSDINNYTEFLGELEIRLSVATTFLKKDCYVCIVVGDWRNGNLISFHKDVMNILQKLGLLFWDCIILETVTRDIAAKRVGQFLPRKYLAKTHEYLLVFKRVE
jgi:DNA modification methylase